MVAPWFPTTSSSEHRITGRVLLTTESPASTTVSLSEPSAPLQPRTRSMVARSAFRASPVSTPVQAMSARVLRPRQLTS